MGGGGGGRVEAFRRGCSTQTYGRLLGLGEGVVLVSLLLWTHGHIKVRNAICQ